MYNKVAAGKSGKWELMFLIVPQCQKINKAVLLSHKISGLEFKCNWKKSPTN